MAPTGRAGPRSALLITAWVCGLILSLGLALWTSVGASSPTLTNRSSSRPSGVAAARAHPGDVGPRSGPTSPALAGQLRTMDPKSLDRDVAQEEARSRGGTPHATPTTDAWLVGEAGTYLVGRGITTGTYESAGAADSTTCRWSVKGTNFTTRRSGSSNSRTVVTIRRTDGFFETEGCSNWHRTS